MKYGIIALTGNSVKLAVKIHGKLPDTQLYFPAEYKIKESIDIKGNFKKFIKKIFNRHRTLIFIMAAGIAVRTISKNLKDKRTDPAVLVIDEKGKYVISLLSGHIGGANKETLLISRLINAKPVITTSSDLNNKLSVDMLAEKINCEIDNFNDAKKITAMTLKKEKIGIVSDYKIKMPSYLNSKANEANGFIYITNKKKFKRMSPSVLLIPKNIIVGIGCKKGISKNNIVKFIEKNFKKININALSIKKIATIDIKKNEKGIFDAADYFKVKTDFFNSEEINKIKNNFSRSEVVNEKIGVYGVCEPAAYLSSNKSGKLILPKTSSNGISIAFWEEFEIS
jgi:cobalt-precorrin 5A hydrolase